MNDEDLQGSVNFLSAGGIPTKASDAPALCPVKPTFAGAALAAAVRRFRFLRQPTDFALRRRRNRTFGGSRKAQRDPVARQEASPLAISATIGSA